MEDEPQAESSERTEGFESQLSEGRQRFLAHVIVNSLECGRRTPDDFIRHFPPSAIMAGLAQRPTLRAKILVPATGVKRKVALKKSPGSSAEDLQIALDEREVDCRTIVDLIDPDDRVRYLDDQALWSFIVEGEFWGESTDEQVTQRARAHVAFMLDRAITDQLVTPRDIVEGISVAKLVELLPRKDLGEIISGALANGRSAKPFTEEDLLRQSPSAVLVSHVPLALIWASVVVSKVATAHGFAETEAAAPEAEATAELEAAASKPEGLADKPEKKKPVLARVALKKVAVPRGATEVRAGEDPND